MTQLVAATDAHFEWMLGGPSPAPLLRLPPGGVDTPETLAMLRDLAKPVRESHGTGVWLIVEDGEVVGMCSYKWPASGRGTVEIGYGVAATRRRLGHATRAVAAIIAEAARDPKVTSLMAETAVANLPSQRVLEANGFRQIGTRVDKEDGDVIRWRYDWE